MRPESRTLRQWCQLSNELGRDLLLAQAEGGNVSIKAASDRLLIKCSGSKLRDASPSHGWAWADAGMVRNGLRDLRRTASGPRRELAYAELLTAAGRTPGRRVSMETGFHALLPQKFVAHAHSVAGMLLGLRSPARILRCVRGILGAGARARVVPVCAPGLELSLRMQDSLRSARREEGGRLSLWVLRHHGLVWAGPSLDALREAQGRLERALRSEFGLEKYPPPHLAGSSECRLRPSRRSQPASGGTWRRFCVCHWPRYSPDLKPQFPDFLIYFHARHGRRRDIWPASSRSVLIRGENAMGCLDRAEVFYAHALLVTLSRGLARRRPLPDRIVRAICGMETERLRLLQRGLP